MCVYHTASSSNSESSQKPRSSPLPYDNIDTNINNHTIGSASNSPQFKSTLSPVDANKTIISSRSRSHSKEQTNDEKVNNTTNTKSIKSMELREVSISKSRSRQFRQRKEPNTMNEPPEIDDDDNDNDSDNDNASSLSDNVEIPVLLFSDSGDEEIDDDIEDDANLKMMQYLVEQENEKIKQEILKMQSYVEEQETIKLKAEAFQEIQAEAMKNQTNDDEEEKKRKALERYEKKQRQRQKEKEEAKEKRKREKEEKKKKQKAKALKRKMAQRQKERLKKREEIRQQRKKELEEYNINEERPTRQQIINMFDKYFYKPFEAKKYNQPKSKLNDSDNSSDDDQDGELGEGGINFIGFKQGLKALGIDKILNKQEISHLFDHMTDSSREYGINAVDFVYFLKQNAITLEPKLATIQRKIISTLAKQQDKEDEMVKEQKLEYQHQHQHEQEIHEQEIHEKNQTLIVIPTIDEKEIDIDNDSDKENNNDDDNINIVGDAPKMIIQISEPAPRTDDIIQPLDTMHDDDDDDDGVEDDDDDDEDDEDDDDDDPNNRRTSISMSESMSMSVSQFANLPSNIPRKSFKAINYNWNDSISKKSFNNYKRLREKFAFRYKHTPRRTKDEELIKVQEQLINDAINANLENENEAPNNNNNNDNNNDNVEGDESENNDIEEKQEEKQDDIANDTEQKDEIEILSKSRSKSKSKSLKRKTSRQSKNTLQDINELKDIDEEEAKEMQEKRSAVVSLNRIKDYKGNEEMNELRKLYRKQYKMKQKLERLRKRSLLNFPAPPKPKDIEEYMDDDTKYICKELKLCICKNTRYTGLANFGINGELGIEIEFTSDCDENGYITGKRVIHFKGMKQAIGRGRIWLDIASPNKVSLVKGVSCSYN